MTDDDDIDDDDTYVVIAMCQTCYKCFHVLSLYPLSYKVKTMSVCL